MSTSFQKKLPITRLRVNPNNVRYEGSATDQNDAIRKIIADQGRKFVNLSKHIAKNGLEPGRSVYVLPIVGTKDYLVLDGNRRMSAVKVLLSKELQKEFSKLLPKNFGKISEEFFSSNKIETVECTVFEVEEAAREWIAVNHGFGEEGITTQDWNSDVRGKVMASYKKVKRLRDGQVLDYLREAPLVDIALKERLRTEQTNNTALRRFLSDDVLPYIGINFNSGYLEFQAQEMEIVKMLVRIVTDFLDKRKRTRDVWDIKARRTYLDELQSEGYLPDLTKQYQSDSSENHAVSNDSEIAGDSDDSIKVEESKRMDMADADPTGRQPELKVREEAKDDSPFNLEDEETSSYSKPKPIKKSREYVFSKTLKISNRNSRITDIYNELTRISVTENPNAVIFLLRAFVEMLVKEYDKKNKVPSAGKDAPLREAVKRAVEHYKNKHGKTDDNDFRGILEACEPRNVSSIFAIESFQQLVHREQLKPIPSEIITRWENIEPAIIHLLANT